MTDTPRDPGLCTEKCLCDPARCDDITVLDPCNPDCAICVNYCPDGDGCPYAPLLATGLLADQILYWTLHRPVTT